MYMDVESLDAVAHLANAKVLVPRRKTFYGVEEVFVEDTSGNVIGFAQHPKR